MTETIHLKKIDEVWMKVDTNPSTLQKLSKAFTFPVKGHTFSPEFRMGVWDGKNKLLNEKNGKIYLGLKDHIKLICEKHGYILTYDEGIFKENQIGSDYGYQLAKEFDAKHTPDQYQNYSIVHSLKTERCIILSPTGSGKSFIIYLLSRHFNKNSKKVLVIVPNVDLVKQLADDFLEYNNGIPLNIHMIYAGKEKLNTSDYVFTTWQSIKKQPKSWFDAFDVLIADEVHRFNAKGPKSLIELTTSISFKYGLTGTLDTDESSKYTLQGLFGKTEKIVKTKTLIENNRLSDLLICAINLQYSEEDKEKTKKLDYKGEIDWIISNEKRNRFIVNLVKNLKGNTLVLFQFVENHGMILEKLLQDSNKTVHFIHGGTAIEERTYVREKVEISEDNVILASYGIFSTGINIKNLDNLVFASPSKSKIRNLQSIGRILRIGKKKSKAVLFDLVDILCDRGSRANYSLRHFREREKYYKAESFPVKQVSKIL